MSFHNRSTSSESEENFGEPTVKCDSETSVKSTSSSQRRLDSLEIISELYFEDEEKISSENSESEASVTSISSSEMRVDSLEIIPELYNENVENIPSENRESEASVTSISSSETSVDSLKIIPELYNENVENIPSENRENEASVKSISSSEMSVDSLESIPELYNEKVENIPSENRESEASVKSISSSEMSVDSLESIPELYNENVENIPSENRESEASVKSISSSEMSVDSLESIPKLYFEEMIPSDKSESETSVENSSLSHFSMEIESMNNPQFDNEIAAEGDFANYYFGMETMITDEGEETEQETYQEDEPVANENAKIRQYIDEIYELDRKFNEFKAINQALDEQLLSIKNRIDPQKRRDDINNCWNELDSYRRKLSIVLTIFVIAALVIFIVFWNHMYNDTRIYLLNYLKSYFWPDLELQYFRNVIV